MCCESSAVPFWKRYNGIQVLKEEMKCTNVQNASTTVEHSIFPFCTAFESSQGGLRQCGKTKDFFKNLLIFKLRNNNLN